jgi:hypothetical protein
MHNEVLELLFRECVAVVLGVPLEQVKREVTWEALEADGLDVVEVAMEIEQHLRSIYRLRTDHNFGVDDKVEDAALVRQPIDQLFDLYEAQIVRLAGGSIAAT